MTLPNDWSIKKCLVLSLSLLLAMLGLTGLGSLGFDVPVLRQIVGFVSLTFVPGMLILRILKIHNVGIIESLLYSAGLSLTFVMATGVVANSALPPLGIYHPITLAPLTATLVAFFLILCFFAYARDKNFRPANPLTEDGGKVTKSGLFANLNPYLLAILLPLLAMLGASLVNSYHNNTLLFALILIVMVITGLVAFNKFIPLRVYPFMIVMIAIALIYQTTLISGNLVGSDIHLEYYVGKQVIENGYWDATIRLTVNSCLSVVMLAPIYSLLLNMDVVWLLKAIYPLLFCLVPLGLFHIFRLQIKPLHAFFATLFFISMPMFTMDMAQLARQQVSELFFVLVILLMVDRKLTLIQRTTLVLIFGFGVVVSYYGMGTGYVGYLLLYALVLIIIKSRPGQGIWQWLIGKSHSLPTDLTSAGALNKKALALIIGASLVFMLGYYSIVASGTGLSGVFSATSVVQSTAEQVVQGVTAPPTEAPPTEAPPTEAPPTEAPPTEAPPTEAPPAETPPVVQSPPSVIQNIIARFPFLNPLTKEPLTQTALGLDFTWASPGGKAWRIFQYLVELCLVIGFIRLFFRPRPLGEFKAEYLSLILVSGLTLLGVFVLPTWSYGMGISRIFQITLLLISPLFLFGGEVIGYGIVKFARSFTSSQLSLDSSAPLRFLILAVLIPYFIFNSGVVFELSRSQTTYFIDIPYSIALSSYRVDMTTTFTEQDTTAADWLSKAIAGENCTVYADYHSNKLLGLQNGLLFTHKMAGFPYDTKEEVLSSPSYIYLGTRNTQKKVLTFATVYAGRQSISFDDLPEVTYVIDKGNRIYNNGGAQVLALSRAPSIEDYR